MPAVGRVSRRYHCKSVSSLSSSYLAYPLPLLCAANTGESSRATGPSAALPLLPVSLWDPLAAWGTPLPAGPPAALHEGRRESRERSTRQPRGDHTWTGRKGSRPCRVSVCASGGFPGPPDTFLGWNIRALGYGQLRPPDVDSRAGSDARILPPPGLAQAQVLCNKMK